MTLEHPLKNKAARRYHSPIKVWVNDAEKKEIISQATHCGLKVSGFMRKVALGYRPVSHIDLDQMDELFRLHSDMGRIGGLLKMLLTNDERMAYIDEKSLRPTLDGVISDLASIQYEIKVVVAKVVGGTPDET